MSNIRIRRCGKRFVLFSLLFLLLSLPPSFAEVCLSDQEFEELEAIFSKLYATLDKQEIAIATLEAQLSMANAQLEKSQNSIETLRLTLSEAERSSAVRERERIKNLVLAALISAVAGFIAGAILL